MPNTKDIKSTKNTDEVQQLINKHKNQEELLTAIHQLAKIYLDIGKTQKAIEILLSL